LGGVDLFDQGLGSRSDAISALGWQLLQNLLERPSHQRLQTTSRTRSINLPQHNPLITAAFRHANPL
jgi:hypothetical protein